MKQFQHMLLQLRTTRRRVRARLAQTVPSYVRPARLVLRIDDVDLPGSLGSTPHDPLPRWQSRLVESIQWLGVIPVTIQAGASGDGALAFELVRFAHRLDCPTLLACDGTGITEEAAYRLVDIGLDAVRIEVSGASGAGEAAARAFRAAGHRCGRALDIEAMVVWSEPSVHAAGAVLDWARRSGCDGYRISAPWRAAEIPSDDALLEQLVMSSGLLDRTPPRMIPELQAMAAAQDGQPGKSGARLGRRCPVGGQRLELSATGGLWCCPFKEPIPEADSIAASWAQARPHLQAIASCGRACAHVELAPEPMLR
jgi:hypothetical protein